MATIEAALIAGNIPPGYFRLEFGFQKWKAYDQELFSSVKESANAGIRKATVKISGSDISEVAISQASKNIISAGLKDTISLDVSDFKTLKVSEDGGVIFINPPYGERLQPEDTDNLYSMIGTTLKHNYQGYSAWIISSNKESLKLIGLKPKEKYLLYNGSLECIFNKYELYAGSKKHIIS